MSRAPRAVRSLLAIPWRQAGLVALCVLAGVAAPFGLARLESGSAASRIALAAPAPRQDPAHPADPIEAALQSAPPAAGPRAPVVATSPVAGWRGPALGLLLGLLLATLREWPGRRMRTVREAEQALGAPVLGAIPTLSARARAAERPTTAP